MQVNPLTGHLTDCNSDGHTGTLLVAPRHKPICWKKNQKGQQCSGICTRYGCVTTDPAGMERGFCDKHWDTIPGINNRWDEHLSRCANRIADARGLNLQARQGIDQTNIQQQLGLPAWSAESHLSPQRMNGVNNAIRRANNPPPVIPLGRIVRYAVDSSDDDSFDDSFDDSMEESSVDDSIVVSDEESGVDDEASYEDSDSDESSDDESVEIVVQPAPNRLKRLKRKADVDINKRAAKKHKKD